MKATTTYRPGYLNRRPLPYPNAMTRRQILGKILDYCLISASCVGVVAMVMFMLVLL